jgi:tRNA (mo5U34)-methyltransferase
MTPAHEAQQGAASSRDDIARRLATVPHWYHRIEVAPGVVTPGINDSPAALRAVGLPDDLLGKRVLDIGTRDGFFAFECERRGAEVVAVDVAPIEHTGFAVAAELLGSKVQYRQRTIWDLSRAQDGEFDVVLCLGLLYHLRDPLAALDLLRSLCRGTLFLETAVLAPGAAPALNGIGAWSATMAEFDSTPLMQFLPGNVANNDPSNFWLPNRACLKAMLEESNFVVDRVDVRGPRAVAVARPRFDGFLERINRIASSIGDRAAIAS